VTDTILRALSGGDRAWMSRAACLGLGDVARLFPPDCDSAATAIEVCNGCPVSSDCLASRAQVAHRRGVWGGTSERERKRMLRMRPKQPAA
jgi:WhiB family redox-sensing transcriptional regulator